MLAAGSVAIREMDGTCIISYLHLQELKWFLSPNQNKSKRGILIVVTRWWIQYIHMSLCAPSVVRGACLSRQEDNGTASLEVGGWRGKRGLGIITAAPWWEGNSQARPVKYKGQRNIPSCQGSPPLLLHGKRFLQGTHRGCSHQYGSHSPWWSTLSIIFPSSVSLELCTEL